MNVYFIPTFSTENEYLENITQGLKNNGVSILSDNTKNKKLVPIDSIVKAIIHKDYVVHFNWIENKITNRKYKSNVNLLIIKVWIALLRLFGTKICWTMHNKVPHRTSQTEKVEVFYKYLLGKCDMVVVHCSESSEILQNEYGYRGKICFIPHGSYIEEHSCLVKFENMKDGHFLYFGAVSEYKNIPVLIDAFKSALKIEPGIELEITGRCRNQQLDEEIHRKIDGYKAITYINKFVSDEELQKSLEKACSTILPYDKTSMLNSGSAIMAYSRGRSTIIPNFGYIKDISNKDFVISYDYDSSKEHMEKLTDLILKHVSDAKRTQDYWQRLGRRAYDFAKDDLNWNNICKRLKDEYEKLFKKSNR